MAIAQVRQRGMSARDLLMPGMPEKCAELIEGELVTMSPANSRHNTIASNITFAFRLFCAQHAELVWGTDNDGFLLSRDPDTLLVPDSALFRRRAQSESPWFEFAPEIAVEVLSPCNNASEMVFRRKRYFDAGTEQFWLVDPEEETIEFHFRDGRVITASGDETVKGEGLAAGMKIVLRDVFRPR